MQKQTYLILIRRTDYGARQMLEGKANSMIGERETEKSFNSSSNIKRNVLATYKIIIIHVKAAVGVRFFDAKIFVKFAIFPLHSFCAHFDLRWKEN